MANHDVKSDPATQLKYPPRGLHPTVSELRTALSTFSSTTYTTRVLDLMTKDDMIYAARQNSLTVNGL